jgi:hypothetical protein
LAQLSEEELNFLRSDDRLVEMRNLITDQHRHLRVEIGTAALAAQECAARFVAALDEYELKLQEAMRSQRTFAGHLASKALKDKGELGLTAGMGILGLVAAPPWSFLLTAISAIVGGQSIRGLVQSSREEVREGVHHLADLKQTPMAVCANARRRAANNAPKTS